MIQYYNCQKNKHFAYECRSKKKEQDDHAYMAETTPAAAAANFSTPVVSATSSLLMFVVEEASNLLLHGSEGSPSNPTHWYLDRGATNLMTSRQEFFCDLDKSTSGFVKFGDNSKIRIEGRGDIEINQKDGKIIWLLSVLFVPDLTANILKLGRLDEEGCRMTMTRGKLTIFYCEDRLFAQVQKSEGCLFLLKLNVVDQRLITTLVKRDVQKENGRRSPSS